MGRQFSYEIYIPDNEKCPFCDEDHKKEYCLYSTQDLMLLQSKYPYGGIENHYLIVPKRHITSIIQATQEEVSQLLDMHRKIAELYDHTPHTVYLRFGAGSVSHLHWHAIPVTPTIEDIIPMLNKN